MVSDSRAGRRPSLAVDSTVRFLAEVVWAGCALLTGAVVARHLGPDGKGVAALLGYLVAVIGPLSALGFGDAAAVLVRQGAVDLRVAVGAATSTLLVSSLVGSLVLVGLATAQFSGDGLWRKLDGSIAVAAVTVPVLAASQVLTLFVESERRIVTTSLVRMLVGATTAVTTAALVLGLEWGVFGVLLGSAIGYGAGLAVLLVRITQLGAPPVPLLQPSLVRHVLSVGVRIQLAFVLVGLSARADMLVVQWFHGGSETGQYSVAITISTLVLFVPVAVGSASYAIVAGMDDRHWGPFTDQLARTVLLIAVAVAVVVAVTAPVVVPAAFGRGFEPSVGTTLLLLPATVLGAQQWILSRAAAARGNGRLVLRSYATGTVVMLVLDLATVPWGGRTAAAVSSIVGSAAGLVVILRGYHEMHPAPHLLRRTFRPGRSDVALLQVLWQRLRAGSAVGEQPS